MPPKASRSLMEAKIEPLAGALPSIGWRWDPETDILSGAFKGNRKAGGLTGSVELTDAEGSVAVLDINNGVVCGIDVVVWPEVSTRSDIQVPARLTDGRVVLAVRRVAGRGGIGRGGYHPLGRDQRLRECVPPLASASAVRSRSSGPRTTSISKWISRAGWPASG